MMKRFLFALCALLYVQASFAQLKEGKVLYERTMQLQMRMQGAPPPPDGAMPRSRTDRFELSFTTGKVLWEALPDVDEGETGGGGPGGPGGGPFMMRFGGDDLVFTNLETGITVARQELASRNYIITDSLRKLSWKLTDETKEILGYKVRKATAIRMGTRNVMAMDNGVMNRTLVADTTAITAWFTAQIPVAAGPEFNGQLPGLILELDINKGRVVYKALEVSNKTSVANIKEPKGGKAVTAAEFGQERIKMLEEMRRNRPPGGNVRVQMNSGQ